MEFLLYLFMGFVVVVIWNWIDSCREAKRKRREAPIKAIGQVKQALEQKADKLAEALRTEISQLRVELPALVAAGVLAAQQEQAAASPASRPTLLAGWRGVLQREAGGAGDSRTQEQGLGTTSLPGTAGEDVGGGFAFVSGKGGDDSQV